jgi:hypothetical protein
MTAYTPSAQAALDTLNRKATTGIPTGLVHFMEHSVIERIAGAEAGEYVNDPYGVYCRMLENIGVNMVDQFLADNPLTMGNKGYEHELDSPTTGGVANIDGFIIKSPEDFVDYVENVGIPDISKKIAEFQEREIIQDVINQESRIQRTLGSNILKAGYSNIIFPTLEYERFGYENYFMAYALYPEIIDRLFELQADYAVKNNRAVVKAFRRAGLPFYHRLDHDMADSSGLLVSMDSLKRSWVGQFARSIKPAVDADFTLLWHCDGNLTELLPYLIDAGVNGFQGFQYEDGMDYVNICKLKAKNGKSMVIQAGVSVTREMPMGTPEDIKKQLKFLVDNGPRTGLFLSTSSSCAPGTPWENIKTALEGFEYYRINGRNG